MNADISIVVPVYNSEETLGELIESILRLDLSQYLGHNLGDFFRKNVTCECVIVSLSPQAQTA